MRVITVLRLRLRSLLRRERVDHELDEELRYHLERDIEESVLAGCAPEEARRVVRRAAAGLQQRKEECRDMRGVNMFDNLMQDSRFAVRQLRKAPGFTRRRDHHAGARHCGKRRDLCVRRRRVDPAASVSAGVASRRRLRDGQALSTVQPVLSRLSRLEEAEHRVFVIVGVSGRRRPPRHTGRRRTSPRRARERRFLPDARCHANHGP